jgi:hypothetical protein
MSTATIWTLEFPDLGYGIGQAMTIVREYTPAGGTPPGITEGGRLGYEIARTSA